MYSFFLPVFIFLKLSLSLSLFLSLSFSFSFALYLLAIFYLSITFLINIPFSYCYLIFAVAFFVPSLFSQVGRKHYRIDFSREHVGWNDSSSRVIPRNSRFHSFSCDVPFRIFIASSIRYCVVLLSSAKLQYDSCGD